MWVITRFSGTPFLRVEFHSKSPIFSNLYYGKYTQSFFEENRVIPISFHTLPDHLFPCRAEYILWPIHYSEQAFPISPTQYAVSLQESVLFLNSHNCALPCVLYIRLCVHTYSSIRIACGESNLTDFSDHWPMLRICIWVDKIN